MKLSSYLPLFTVKGLFDPPIVYFFFGGIALVVIVAIILVIVFVKARKGKTVINNSDWLIALGDKENIKEVTATGSRLSLVLVDKEKIDREKLKQLGVSSVLVMSNKVTLVIEDKAEQIATSIQKDL